MKKILIVEDDPKISAALVVRLRAAGYQIVTAYDATSAPSVAVKNRPDFKVAERLQLLGATVGTPMIFITASKKPEFHQRATEPGAVGFFEKSYEREKLLAAVRAALGD
jgi:two-component system response regulator GlrR